MSYNGNAIRENSAHMFWICRWSNRCHEHNI